MRLQDELDALRIKSEAGIPPEDVAVMHRATRDLEASGILDRVPKVGERAPHFALQNTQGVLVDSRALLERGLMVLTFYRGGW